MIGNLPVRPAPVRRPRALATRAAILELWQQGTSRNEIARALGMGRSTVYYHLRQMGAVALACESCPCLRVCREAVGRGRAAVCEREP